MSGTTNDLPVRDNAERSRYEMALDGGEVAFASYRRTGDVVMVTHTGVPRALEGRGLGSMLVRGMLADIRARGIKVRPLCGFVAAYLRRHPEEADLVG